MKKLTEEQKKENWDITIITEKGIEIINIYASKVTEHNGTWEICNYMGGIVAYTPITSTLVFIKL